MVECGDGALLGHRIELSVCDWSCHGHLYPWHAAWHTGRRRGVRSVRSPEIAADIGPQLPRMQGKLDNLERALNLALMTQCRLAESKIGYSQSPMWQIAGD
jgi:hypothetical protein